MSIVSVLFLAVIGAGVVLAIRRYFSEKTPVRDQSNRIGFDPSLGGAEAGSFAPVPSLNEMHGASHSSGCESAGSHDVGVTDCGQGGFDGGGHH